MTGFGRILLVETRLQLRDVPMLLFSVALPTVILVLLGAVPALRRPDPLFEGHSLVAYLAPSLLVISLAMVGLNALPNVLAGYRERGVLRRLSTTPAAPVSLLAAQLVVNLAVAVLGAVLLIGVGRLFFGIPLPRAPFGFAVAYLLGTGALFALGLLVAAVARSTRAAAGLATALNMSTMFLGGVYLPRFLLPDALVRVGDVTPPGVRPLLDAWSGTPPQPAHLAIMAAVTVLAGTLAAKLFRWE
ncbi:ABC transporter permease [Micromonospora echinofusca]|uniref:ABC transporter permease n=1 Tax=Micromonospora echinofusca TaxID=47858 RepID=A0ABS3VTJ3_MICEH|nr:ABC transporter permease [Micromonospora echinofusca]MBO4207791.1 ABC transporter permease [Micromonospora echinofusca]